MTKTSRARSWGLGMQASTRIAGMQSLIQSPLPLGVCIGRKLESGDRGRKEIQALWCAMWATGLLVYTPVPVPASIAFISFSSCRFPKLYLVLKVRIK